jgi:hypothetical protein
MPGKTLAKTVVFERQQQVKIDPKRTTIIQIRNSTVEAGLLTVEQENRYVSPAV